MNKRPTSVTIVALVYVVMGIVGFVYHFNELRGAGAFPYGMLWVELVRLLAVVCGVFMLIGQDWARWVALAWIAFHVVISLFHAWPEFAMHCLFLALIAWILLRAPAALYFRNGGTGPEQPVAS